MALLSAADQQTLRGMFDDMKQPVTLLFFTQAIECETCDETKRILAELTEVTDEIVVEEVNLVLDKERAATYGIERAPALVLLDRTVRTRASASSARRPATTSWRWWMRSWRSAAPAIRTSPRRASRSSPP